jgi:cyanophycinase
VADDPAVARAAASMTGFFFGGGDQYRYVQTMTRGAEQADSVVLRAVRQRLRAGAVVAGTSAGAQILAGPDMITGGTSHTGVRDGSRPGYFTDAAVLGYLPLGGFGFFDDGLVDTHFSRRGRYGRSIRLAADTGHDRVFGIDENTALTVTGIGTGHRRLRVLGTAGVSVLDLRAARTRTVAGRWAVDGVRWSFLTDGDAYAARSRSPRFAPGKRPVRPAPGCALTPSGDAFYELVPQAVGLIEGRDCTAAGGVTYETDPQFRVELRRGRGAAGLRAPGAAVTSFTGLVIGIHA